MLYKEYMDDFIRVQFDSKYKGKKKDVLNRKLKFFLITLVVSLCLILFSFYYAFWEYNRVITNMDRILSYVCYALGVIGVIISPIVGFTRTINKGLKGRVTVDLSKNGESGAWGYTIYTDEEGHTVSVGKGEISMLREDKTFFKMRDTFGKDYCLPKSEISDAVANELRTVSLSVQKYRSASNKKNQQ